jgi:hypothetical protein
MIKKFDCPKNIEHAQKKLKVVKIFFELADEISINISLVVEFQDGGS